MLFKEQVALLNKGDICYVMGGTRGSDEIEVLAFFKKVHLWREKKGIKSKMLFNESQRETMLNRYPKKAFPSTSINFITHSSPVAINIYANRTVIIIFGKKISAIQIFSKDVAESFIEYFNLIWETSEK